MLVIYNSVMVMFDSV